jgi:hypothetical protein
MTLNAPVEVSGSNSPLKPNFADTARKIERPNHHLFEFERIAKAFFDKHPWNTGMLPEQRGKRFVIPVGERRPFPDRAFSLIIGDIVHNLRTSLDYILAACAIAHGNSIDQTEFPFGLRRSDILPRMKRRVRPAGDVAEALVLAARPYRRGNELLWAMAELDRQDKHRLVVPTACLTKVAITAGGWNGLPPTTVFGRFRDGEGVLVEPALGYEKALMMEASYNPEIVFAHRSPLRGRPCIESLWAMSEATATVLQSFEDAFGTIRFSRKLLEVSARRLADLASTH